MNFFKKPVFISKLSKRQLITFVGFLIILISLPLAIFLVQQQQIYRGRALGPEAVPTNVKIANLHGGGFSVSWTSVNPTTGAFQETTGSVFWGTDQNNLNQEAFDDRGQDISSTTHHVSIFNLNPNTTYYLKIKSGPDNYGKSGESWVKAGVAVQQATPVELTLSGNPQPIYGYIKNQAGNKVEGALVYAKLKKDDSETKSALMSTVTKTDEGWVMDAKNARMENLTSFFGFDDNDQVLIEIQAAQNGIASANFAINQCSPAQDITVVPPTVTPTLTSTPTLGPTATPTPTATLTPTPTPSLTPIPVPTTTPTPIPPPTGTPTPTPTPEPDKAHLTFKVRFQGINQQRPDKTVKITLTKAGNTIATFENEGVGSDENGIYTGRIMNITPDTYDIFIKGWAHLQKKFSGITLTEGENTQDFSGTELLTGDATDDNKINAQDIVILVQDYRPNTPPNSLADFNLDGTVNAQDVRFIVENYRREGE